MILRPIVPLVLVGALLSAAYSSAADPAPTTNIDARRQEASARFARGIRFYEDGDYVLALIEFERAHELVEDYRVLYNVGQVSIQLGRFARARLALEEYLQKGGSDLDAERIAAVKKDLTMLAERTAMLSVEGVPPEAEVSIDGVELAATASSTRSALLDAGEHRLEVLAPGFEPFSARMTLAGAEQRTLRAELRALETERARGDRTSDPIAVEPPPPRPPSPAPPSRTWNDIVWISTGTLAAAGLATGIAAAAESGELSSMKKDPTSEALERDAQASLVNNLLLTTDIVLLGAAALGATGVYLEWKLPPKEQEPTANVSSSFALRPHGLGAQILGEF